ncbi:RDD family protein [Brevibacillus sp. SYP-B805]|uniref:RDD family protein n=1 Tax=Brevibacillus sp. SYP-B805 TaxID=1578199 RepID=UPI0013EBA904|nr:RDD family protein [Brevibacillus sp. SYP-B805]NGQ93847.1 RDD family protein [Brevibacillus sp. SYP-B805]
MNETIDRQVSVVTPEQVRLQFQTAGLGSRAAAQLIDGVILLVVNITLLVLFRIVAFGAPDPLREAGGFALAVLIILFFLLNSAYYIVLEYWLGGQTLGKRWMGIRVIQENGQGITFLAALIRNLFRIIDNLPAGYFLGALVCFFHPRDKRLGDMVAGTIVVQESGSAGRAGKKRLEKELQRWNPQQLGIRLHVEEKGRMDRKDWHMLAAFIERLPLLADERKRELGRRLATHLVEKGIIRDRELAAREPVRLLIAVYEEVKEEWQL